MGVRGRGQLLFNVYRILGLEDEKFSGDGWGDVAQGECI